MIFIYNNDNIYHDNIIMATATDQQTNDMIKLIKQNITYKGRNDAEYTIGKQLLVDINMNIIYPVRVYELYCDLIYGFSHIYRISKFVDKFNTIYPGNARIVLKSSLSILNEYLASNNPKLKITEISCMCTRLLYEYDGHGDKRRKYDESIEHKNVVKFIVDSFLKHVTVDMLDKIIEMKSTILQRTHKKESYITYILEFFIRYNSPYLGELLTATCIPNYLIKLAKDDEKLLTFMCQNEALLRYVDMESDEIKNIYSKYLQTKGVYKNVYYYGNRCVFDDNIDPEVDSKCIIS